MDDQGDRLEVSLSNPRVGWIEVAISTTEKKFKETVSYTPNDFVFELETGSIFTVYSGR